MEKINMVDLLSKITADFQKQRDEIFKKAILENATPPVKGEITRGKMKWRGITMIHQDQGLDFPKMWIEQRGKIISPIVTMAPMNL